jgi:hypothetical protein
MVPSSRHKVLRRPVEISLPKEKRVRSISAVANEINSRASEYEVGNLQSLRKQMKGLSRGRSIIFDTSKQSVNEAEGWAFHTGGREELQFNIGIESHLERFRFGVAFSLETSRSFPDITPLFGKIERFNEFLRHNESALEQFRMWIWCRDKIIKPDTAVRKITDDEIVTPNFIFLGRAVPLASLNISEILSTFDQLLPIYLFVETESIVDYEKHSRNSYSAFEFREGVTVSDVETTLRGRQDEISIVLRSNKIKQKLVEELGKQKGNKLAQETPSGNGGRIDLVVLLPSGEYDFYEIKPALFARHAIREALPQLLEYAYRRGGKEARRLFIASQPPLDRDSDDFLSALRKKGLPIHYKQVSIT